MLRKIYGASQLTGPDIRVAGFFDETVKRVPDVSIFWCSSTSKGGSDCLGPIQIDLSHSGTEMPVFNKTCAVPARAQRPDHIGRRAKTILGFLLAAETYREPEPRCCAAVSVLGFTPMLCGQHVGLHSERRTPGTRPRVDRDKR